MKYALLTAEDAAIWRRLCGPYHPQLGMGDRQRVARNMFVLGVQSEHRDYNFMCTMLRFFVENKK